MPTSKLNHALIIGGTGMLKRLALALSEHCETTSIVARDKAKLKRLAAAGRPGAINPISLNYTDRAEFKTVLGKNIATYGRPELVISWIHATAPGAALDLAALIDRSIPKRSCRFYEILSSAAADPNRRTDRRADLFTPYPGIEYHFVILGFIIERNNPSRWLTDEEICDGIRAAVESGDRHTVVGTVEPWSARP